MNKSVIIAIVTAAVAVGMIASTTIAPTTALAAAPPQGPWTFIQGASPTSASTSSLKVGTVTQGNLVNWKWGNFVLQGTYNSVTGKVIFSTNIGGLTKTWTGYYFAKSPCSSGDIPNCAHNMAGTWTWGTSTRGWTAGVFTSSS